MKHLLLMVVVILMLVSSCKKDKEGCTDSSATNYDTEATKDDGSCTYTYSATDEKSSASSSSGNVTTAIYEDAMLFTYAQYETDNNGNLSKTQGQSPVPACVAVSVAQVGFTQWPKLLTIDFGSSNCLCDDGKYRRGKIEVRINDSWATPNISISEKDSMIISLDNYFVNDTMITGERAFIKDTVSTSAIMVSAIVNNAGVIFPGTIPDTITWNYTGSFQLTFGTILDYNDNTISLGINGSISNKGKLYTIQTLQNLATEFSCLSTCLFTSGELKLSNTETEIVQVGPNSYTANVVTDATINFGTGTCDGNIDLTTTVTGTAVSGGKQLFSESSTQQINCDDYTNWE